MRAEVKMEMPAEARAMRAARTRAGYVSNMSSRYAEWPSRPSGLRQVHSLVNQWKVLRDVAHVGGGGAGISVGGRG